MDRIYWYLDEVDIFDTLMVLQNPCYLLDEAKMETILHKIIKCFSDDQSPKLAVYMREDSNSMLRLQKNQKEQGSARMKDEQPDVSSKSLSPPPPLSSCQAMF